MTEHIKKPHPDHINLTGMDVRYFGNLLALVKAAAKTKVVPLNPMELLWVIRMEKLANRTEIIDIENELELPSLEPEPDVRPAIDVEKEEPSIAAFEDDGGYTGPAHD